MKTANHILSLATLMFLLCTRNLGAQQQTKEALKPTGNTSHYNTAVGLRAGETSGFTFKKFVDQTSAFEGILGIWPNAVGFTALYEKHAPAFDIEGMHWYYGGGGHATFESGRIYDRYNYRDGYFYRYRSAGNVGLGVDGIIGLEYKIKGIPFAISLDVKPFMELNTNDLFYVTLDPGVGIKVAF